ncbi:hypothetical protein [Leptotrichia sp. oral taxon 225]
MFAYFISPFDLIHK